MFLSTILISLIYKKVISVKDVLKIQLGFQLFKNIY